MIKGVVLFVLVTFESILSGHMEEVGKIEKLMINLYKAFIVEGLPHGTLWGVGFFSGSSWE